MRCPRSTPEIAGAGVRSSRPRRRRSAARRSPCATAFRPRPSRRSSSVAASATRSCRASARCARISEWSDRQDAPLRRRAGRRGCSESRELNAQKRVDRERVPRRGLVIEARNEAGAGTIGDILALRALRRGAAGIVTDGAVRDSAAVSASRDPHVLPGAHASVLGTHHYPARDGCPCRRAQGFSSCRAMSSSATRRESSSCQLSSPRGCARRRRAGARRGVRARARRRRREHGRCLPAADRAPTRVQGVVDDPSERGRGPDEVPIGSGIR